MLSGYCYFNFRAARFQPKLTLSLPSGMTSAGEVVDAAAAVDVGVDLSTIDEQLFETASRVAGLEVEASVSPGPGFSNSGTASAGDFDPFGLGATLEEHRT